MIALIFDAAFLLLDLVILAVQLWPSVRIGN